MTPQSTEGLEDRGRSAIIIARQQFELEMKELDALAEQHETRERGLTRVMLGMAASLMISIAANVVMGWLLWKS